VQRVSRSGKRATRNVDGACFPRQRATATMRHPSLTHRAAGSNPSSLRCARSQVGAASAPRTEGPPDLTAISSAVFAAGSRLAASRCRIRRSQRLHEPGTCARIAVRDVLGRLATYLLRERDLERRTIAPRYRRPPWTVQRCWIPYSSVHGNPWHLSPPRRRVSEACFTAIARARHSSPSNSPVSSREVPACCCEGRARPSRAPATARICGGLVPDASPQFSASRGDSNLSISARNSWPRTISS
jgi:hypothetical protein